MQLRFSWEVGGFCCPAPPVPLESPSVARWGPTALKLCNVCPLGRQLRGNRECLVVVGTCVNEPSRWPGPIGNRVFIALVDPISPPSETAETRDFWWRRRGTAPRVRNAYSTRQSTDIAGLPQRLQSRDLRPESQGFSLAGAAALAFPGRFLLSGPEAISDTRKTDEESQFRRHRRDPPWSCGL